MSDAPVPARPDWHRRAACRGVGPLVFYPDDKTPPWIIRRALTMCESCPVRRECADAGADENFGIWGGVRVGDNVGRRIRSQPPKERTS